MTNEDLALPNRSSGGSDEIRRSRFFSIPHKKKARSRIGREKSSRPLLDRAVGSTLFYRERKLWHQPKHFSRAWLPTPAWPKKRNHPLLLYPFKGLHFQIDVDLAVGDVFLQRGILYPLPPRMPPRPFPEAESRHKSVGSDQLPVSEHLQKAERTQF